jgi:hypothetical protein
MLKQNSRFLELFKNNQNLKTKKFPKKANLISLSSSSSDEEEERAEDINYIAGKDGNKQNLERKEKFLKI